MGEEQFVVLLAAIIWAGKGSEGTGRLHESIDEAIILRDLVKRKTVMRGGQLMLRRDSTTPAEALHV